ncbi:MAG: GTP-binding protein [Armatimonadetes bacterium]|nr:GTP-binding protein [Armatimonadota bacterium]
MGTLFYEGAPQTLVSNQIDPFLVRFSPQTRAIVGAAWSTLPPDLRRSFVDTLGTLNKLLGENPTASTDLLSAIQKLADPLVRPLADIAVVGPVNVGKSSLYNTIVPDPARHAAVGPIHGTTREVCATSLGLFNLVDTPGADRATAVGEEERQAALQAARDTDFLLVAFDAARGITASDKALYDELAALGKPHLVVLNKIDLIEAKHRKAVVEAAAATLGLATEAVVPTSALKGTGTERLVLELAAAEPRLLAHLGKVLVPMRRKLAMQAVRRSTLTAVVVALTPIPMLDLIPLAAIQVSLILTIARIYDRPMTVARGGEVAATFGIGMLARTLFYELTKLGGLPGWVLSASVAGSATLAMGSAAIQWFETGKKPTRAQVRQTTKRLQSRFTEYLRNFRRKPNKKQLTQDLEAHLPGMAELEEETLFE